MRNKNVSCGLTAVLIVALTVLGMATSAIAQTETALYSFGSSGDGINPAGKVVFDAAGKIYGTTVYGGAYGNSGTGGTVFELTPVSGGGWTETLLHSFSQGTDGEWPYGSVILGPSGSLYGTTFYGGISGQGTVYELRPIAGGGWSKQILHGFQNDGKDGLNPDAGLVSDADGNLYGTTLYGGTYNQGTVFELLHKAGGGWAEKILHSFTNNGTDGFNPFGYNLVLDAVGNVYGTTVDGGLYRAGIAFELITFGGQWKEKILHHFGHGTDGKFPSGLVLDASGNLYGTTSIGGAQSEGTMFVLSPKSGGGWTYTIPYSFVYQGLGGFQPISALTFDTSGNLYGAAQDGGTYGFGTIYELSPTSGGSWTEMALYSFSLNGLNGYLPGNVTLDASGNIYGPTYRGGTYNLGTVFEITP